MSHNFLSPTYCGIKYHNVDSGKKSKPSQRKSHHAISLSSSPLPFSLLFIYINKPLGIIKHWEKTNKNKEGNHRCLRKEKILMKAKFKTIILHKFPENTVSIKRNCCCGKRQKTKSLLGI